MTEPLIFEANLEDFEQSVIAASHQTPLLVDFWADWCGPCHAVVPALKSVIADREGEIRLAKIEVDEGENMKLAGRYAVRGFPTVMLLVNGEEVSRFAGAKPAHWIDQWIDESLA